jgi:hypothetical protein
MPLEQFLGTHGVWNKNELERNQHFKVQKLLRQKQRAARPAGTSSISSLVKRANLGVINKLDGSEIFAISYYTVSYCIIWCCL